jgi:hypothetical protein
MDALITAGAGLVGSIVGVLGTMWATRTTASSRSRDVRATTHKDVFLEGGEAHAEAAQLAEQKYTPRLTALEERLDKVTAEKDELAEELGRAKETILHQGEEIERLSALAQDNRVGVALVRRFGADWHVYGWINRMGAILNDYPQRDHFGRAVQDILPRFANITHLIDTAIDTGVPQTAVIPDLKGESWNLLIELVTAYDVEGAPLPGEQQDMALCLFEPVQVTPLGEEMTA